MNISKKLHYGTLVLGILLFMRSIILAIFFSSPYFYTWFAVGDWLILDFIDYHKNKTSILGYFYNHKHRATLLLFFLVATFMAFLIDYVYGVRLSGMWQWQAYSNIHFVRMYTIMNTAYIFGMYELFRVIRTYLKPFISNQHEISFRLKIKTQTFLNTVGIILGIFFLLIPFLSWHFQWVNEMKYIMLLPFMGMWFLSDSITSLLKGKSILGEIIRGNMLQIISLLLTSLLATFFTELINLSAHEWIYQNMPFENLQILKIPMAVFIGWIPLVIGVISMLNMIKHVNYLRKK